MGKSGKRFMMMVFVIMLMLSGCQSSKKAEPIDFQADMEWKIPDPAAKEKPRILFVGNSHIFYNNLSGMFVQIAKSFGNGDNVYELTKGYYTLKKFADPEDSVGAKLKQVLTKQKWDFVILQENTSVALSDKAEEEMFPYARILDEEIRANGAQTAFLMTWAPREGATKGFRTQNCEELQNILANHYLEISGELESLVIPAGVSFMRCMEEYPEIELWDPDGQHPSPAGAYLTACTAYAVIFQKSPENCTFTGNLEMEEALKLQKIAADVVLKKGT